MIGGCRGNIDCLVGSGGIDRLWVDLCRRGLSLASDLACAGSAGLSVFADRFDDGHPDFGDLIL